MYGFDASIFPYRQAPRAPRHLTPPPPPLPFPSASISQRTDQSTSFCPPPPPPQIPLLLHPLPHPQPSAHRQGWVGVGDGPDVCISYVPDARSSSRSLWERKNRETNHCFVLLKSGCLLLPRAVRYDKVSFSFGVVSCVFWPFLHILFLGLPSFGRHVQVLGFGFVVCLGFFFFLFFRGEDRLWPSRARDCLSTCSLTLPCSAFVSLSCCRLSVSLPPSLCVCLLATCLSASFYLYACCVRLCVCLLPLCLCFSASVSLSSCFLSVSLPPSPCLSSSRLSVSLPPSLCLHVVCLFFLPPSLCLSSSRLSLFLCLRLYVFLLPAVSVSLPPSLCLSSSRLSLFLCLRLSVFMSSVCFSASASMSSSRLSLFLCLRLYVFLLPVCLCFSASVSMSVFFPLSLFL